MEQQRNLPLSEEEKWQACVRSDGSYDGRCYVAVKTTGIFCRPSCTARKPLRKNVAFYDTREEAQANGYRPCKRCRPDLAEFRPAEEAAELCRRLLEREYRNPAPLNEVLKEMNISSGHMGAIFKQHYGVTPVIYRNRLRVEAARRMLRETKLGVAEIALDCGFKSLAPFYEAFKRQTGKTPQGYRAESREEHI
ncbi:MAG TPA: Ada metal-binding domain-containing protein [Feifaniaceae bacterium]|nr:Ada metal-binding domain-containing protein [Feifaniaceae bacterium]